MATREKFIGVRDAAQWLGVAEETVRRYIRDGLLIAYKPAGVYLVKPSDIDLFLERGLVKADDKPQD